jgi:hypothetical protein
LRFWRLRWGCWGIRYAGNDEPEYIQSAEIRVGSYLTSDYGVACGSKKVNDLRWELDCTHQEEENIPVCGVSL